MCCDLKILSDTLVFESILLHFISQIHNDIFKCNISAKINSAYCITDSKINYFKSNIIKYTK